MAMSTVFDVTTDYLLKSSEIDDLSVKTEMLERQQHQVWGCILYSIAVYLVFFAVCFVEHDLNIWKTGYIRRVFH